MTVWWTVRDIAANLVYDDGLPVGWSVATTRSWLRRRAADDAARGSEPRLTPNPGRRGDAKLYDSAVVLAVWRELGEHPRPPSSSPPAP